MISKNFFKSSLIFSIAGTLPLGTAIILLPYYTKYLNKELYGELVIYLAIIALLQIIITFYLDISIIHYYFRFSRKPDFLKKYISTIVISMLLLSIGFTVLLTILGTTVFDSLLREKKLTFFPYIFISIGTAICNCFLKALTTLLINIQKPAQYFWVNIVYFVITCSLTILLLNIYPNTLIGPMWSRMLAGLSIFIFSLYFFFKEYGFFFHLKILRKAIKYSFPYYLNLLLLWATSYVNIFLLEYFVSIKDVGIYDFVNKCTFGIDLLLISLANAIYPKIYKIWGDSNLKETTTEVNKYFNVFTLITLISIAVSIFVLPIIIPLIVKKKEFLEGFKFLPMICISFCFRNILHMHSAPYIVYARNKNLFKIYLYSTIIQVLISVVLIKYFGILGAVLSLVVNRQIMSLFFIYDSNKFFSFKVNRWKIWYLPALYFSIVVVGEMVKDYFNFFFLYGMEIIILITLIYFIYKSEVKQYYYFLLSLVKR